MEEKSIRVEYRKFASFLKDYIKNMSRGELFLISDEKHEAGEIFNFEIQVPNIAKPLNATGKIVFVGENEAGEKGFAIDFVFDEESGKFLSGNLKQIVSDKYGNVWGEKLICLIERKYEN